jgi:iron complex outermembrane receptor protein
MFKFGNFAKILYVCLLCLATVIATAQDTGTTLSGTIVDKDGKAIAKADVVVTNDATSGARKTTSGDDGRFSISELTAGVYTVTALAPGFGATTRADVRLGGGTLDISVTLAVASVSESVTVQAVESIAAEMAPMQSSLEAHSAKSEISQAFVENFTPQIGDYSEVLLMAPGTFSVNPNGPGLGQANEYFRGFADGEYTMQFDGIPFEDTNTPSHHTWTYFPGLWIGGTEFDRSPGTASSVGPTNFGGTIDLLSREVPTSIGIQASISYGSFGTKQLDLGIDSGLFGPDKKSSLLVDVNDLRSNGYQTHNYFHRDAGNLKYQYKVDDHTTLTVYTNFLDLWTNTPKTTGPTAAQVAQNGVNFLLSGNYLAPGNTTSSNPYYWPLDYYHIQTNFSYFGYHSDLGSGWKVDNKLYSYHYWNKENYVSSTTVGAPLAAFSYSTSTSSQFSGVDKLNGYTKFGDVLSLSKESKYGIFRTGLWYEWAYTDRYQAPAVPTATQGYFDAVLPNFHEHFLTDSFQPFLEYEWRATSRLSITAGVRWSYYTMDLTQDQDNGKTVGCLGGVLTQVTKTSNTGTEFCAGGAPWTKHEAPYLSTEPSLDARYRILHGWSVYGQYAAGSIIPPSSVYDVKNAAVLTLPSLSRTNTYQVGSVFKKNKLTLDVDAYYVRFQNAYTFYTDPTTGEQIYTLPGDSRTHGLEAESNYYFGKGISVYGNLNAGKAFYVNSGLWVANTPSNIETVGVLYQHKSWDFAIFNKRVGPMWNDNGTFNQSVPINPFELTNVYLNYTIKEQSYLRGTKLRLSVNNIQNSHAITGVVPATVSQVYVPNGGDVLTLLPGRSITMTVTMGLAPRR